MEGLKQLPENPEGKWGEYEIFSEMSPEVFGLVK